MMAKPKNWIRWIKLTLLAALIFVNLFVAYPVAQRVSQTETGGSRLASYWADSIDQFTGEQSDFRKMERLDRARFWLTEFKSIYEKHPDCCVLLAGHDLLVTFKGEEKYANEAKQIDFEETVAQSRELQLRIATRATMLEPGRTLWWQLRAIICQPRASEWEDDPERFQSWLDLLQECQSNDQDNGLYDYLAASALFERSIDIVELVEEPYVRIVVANDEQFAEAVARLELGLEKKRFELDDQTFTRVQNQFIELTSIPVWQRPYASFGSAFSECRLLGYRILRFQLTRLDRLRVGNLLQVRKILNQLEQMEAQFLKPTSTQKYDRFEQLSRQSTFGSILDYCEKNPGVLSVDEKNRIEKLANSDVDQTKIDLAIEKIYPRPNADSKERLFVYRLNTILVQQLPACVCLLTLLALAGTLTRLLWKIERDATSGQRVVDRVADVLIVIVACVVSFVLIGFYAESIFDELIWPWIITCVLLAIPVGLLLRVTWIFFRRRARFGLGEIFFATSVMALLFAVVYGIDPTFEAYMHFPFDVYIEAFDVKRFVDHRWYYTEAANETSASQIMNAKPYFVQVYYVWLGNLGYTTTLILWLFMFAIWQLCRRLPEPLRQFQWIRVRMFLVRLTWPSVFLALILLTQLHRTLPSMLDRAEANYQYQMNYHGDRELYWKRVGTELEKMKQLEAESENEPSNSIGE